MLDKFMALSLTLLGILSLHPLGLLLALFMIGINAITPEIMREEKSQKITLTQAAEPASMVIGQHVILRESILSFHSYSHWFSLYRGDTFLGTHKTYQEANDARIESLLP